MGLDVYLYRYENFGVSQEIEDEYNRRTEALWDRPDYESLSDKEKDEIRVRQDEIAEELGMHKDNYGHEPEGKTQIELDSKNYPDHLFKIGYLRSSYNGGGLNAILSKTIDTSLSEIFGLEEDEYKFQPDWEASRRRAEEALDKFKQYLKGCGPYSIMEVSGNPFMTSELPASEQEAMEIFQKERKDHEGRETDSLFSGNYSNKYGEFYFGKPREVVGFIPGKKKFLRQSQPCMYIICKSDHNFEFYTQSLEIIIEMCDWVMAQPDKEKYYLHWSG